MTRKIKMAVPVLLAILASTAAAATAEASASNTASANSTRLALSAAVVHPLTWIDTQAYFGSYLTCADWGAKMISAYPNSYDAWECVQNSNGTWELWLDYYG